MSEPVAVISVWQSHTELHCSLSEEPAWDKLTDGEHKLYTADAIHAAVLAEREAIIQACENELFSEETTPFTKGYNGGIRNCLIVIKARGAA